MDTNRESPKSWKRLWRTTLAWSLVLLAAGVGLLIWIDTHTGLARYVPSQWKDVIKAVIILVIGGIISALIERRLFR